MSKLIKKGFAGNTNGKVIAVRLFPSSPTKMEEMERNDFSQKLEAAQKEAEKIVEEAKLKAIQIENEMKVKKDRLEEERRQIFEQAKEKGFNEGFAQGKEMGYLEVEKDIQLAKQTVIDAKNEFDQAIEKSELMILSIALKAAQKIVKSTLEEKKEMFLPIVKEAIEDVKHSSEIQIYVHPKYYSPLIERKDELFSNMPIDCQIFVHPKEELDETACFIETESGLMDVGIDRQFQQLTEALFERLVGKQT